MASPLQNDTAPACIINAARDKPTVLDTLGLPSLASFFQSVPHQAQLIVGSSESRLFFLPGSHQVSYHTVVYVDCRQKKKTVAKGRASKRRPGPSDEGSDPEQTDAVGEGPENARSDFLVLDD